MQDFHELSQSELAKWLERNEQQGYHAKQIFDWVYEKGVRDWAAMTNLAAPLRQALAEAFHLDILKEESLVRVAKDAVDITYRLRDGRMLHSLARPGLRNGEIHISSQIGQAADCCFLPLGRKQWTRHLRASEMIEQALITKQRLGKGGRLFFDHMGEPLANARHLVAAITALCDTQRGGFKASHMQVATVGLLPGLQALLKLNLPIPLTIELHAPDQRLRQSLIPVAKKNRMDDLFPLLQRYSQQTGQVVTFKYCLIKDLNDSLRQANELARLLRRTRARVDLYTLPQEHAKKYAASPKKQVKDFRNVLYKEKVSHQFSG